MPKKSKTQPAAQTPPKPEVVPPVRAESALQVSPVPDWVDFHPRADFRLVAWENDESTVEVRLTAQEYEILKDHLARLRGYALAGEATHA